MLPWYQKVDTIEKACTPPYPIDDRMVWKYTPPEFVLQWWVGGHKDKVRDWLEIQEKKRTLTDEDIRGRLIELKRQKRTMPLLWRLYKPTDEDVVNWRERDLGEFDVAVKLQAAFGLESIVKTPG